jgi:hypothetical protein
MQDVLNIGKFSYYGFKPYKSVKFTEVEPGIANGIIAA